MEPEGERGDVVDLDTDPPPIAAPPAPISIASEEMMQDRQKDDSDVEEVQMAEITTAPITPTAGVKRMASDPLSPSKTARPGASSSAAGTRSMAAAASAQAGDGDPAPPMPELTSREIMAFAQHMTRQHERISTETNTELVEYFWGSPGAST